MDSRRKRNMGRLINKFHRVTAQMRIGFCVIIVTILSLSVMFQVMVVGLILRLVGEDPDLWGDYFKIFKKKDSRT